MNHVTKQQRGTVRRVVVKRIYKVVVFTNGPNAGAKPVAYAMTIHNCFHRRSHVMLK
ncbi:hypothetical protein PAMC26510_31470 [Caballeronia sordidicola]|uniref:Uncharacterized protein n=1 Tax=Caballeronia sordidicola TaxID=196367 RepID=A0A242M7P8_CABSO|nr:hypothetical protein PAMC26510_31470 [Caballeronia sordidicola]